MAAFVPSHSPTDSSPSSLGCLTTSSPSVDTAKTQPLTVVTETAAQSTPDNATTAAHAPQPQQVYGGSDYETAVVSSSPAAYGMPMCHPPAHLPPPHAFYAPHTNISSPQHPMTHIAGPAPPIHDYWDSIHRFISRRLSFKCSRRLLFR